MNGEKEPPTFVELIDRLERDRHVWTALYVVMGVLLFGAAVVLANILLRV